MTTYRLFPSASGPGTAVSYWGNFLSGVCFAVAGGGNWFQGYWWWVAASGQSTSAVKCALWSPTSLGTGSVVAGSVVTSGTLTAGQWNYIPLTTPIQLAPSLDPATSVNGSAYIAGIGCNGNFPDTNNYWGAGQTAPSGITNGPLTAYSGKSASLPAPYTIPQGCFTTAGSDPAVTMPQGASGTDNFWVDVQVSDTAPAGYAGSYRIWPAKADANGSTSTDTTNNDVIATEVHLSQACTLNKIWYYSQSSAGVLGNWAGVYQITGANSGTLVAQIASPSWSGAAGSGWVSAPFTAGTVIPPGSYKVCVGGPPANWGPKDASTGYFNVGAGSNGITSGPLSVPKLSAASTAYNYNGNAGGTPPYSDGTTLPGQPTFAIGAGPAYPYLFAPVTTPSAGSSQNYWVDLEVTPAPIALVQSKNTSASATTTLTSGTGLGNTVVYAIFSHDGPFSATSPKVGGSAYPAAYQAFTAQSPDLAVWFAIWVFPDVPASATAFSTTLAAGNMDGNVGSCAYEFSGLGPAPVADVHVSGTGTTAGLSSGASPNTNYAPELVIGAGVEYGVVVTTPGAPWTGTLQPGSNNYCIVNYQIATSSGSSYTYAPGSSANQSWVAGVVTIAPAQAPAAPPPAAQPGRTWLRQFRHRQIPQQAAPAAAPAAVTASGTLDVTGTAAATAAVTASGTLDVTGAGTGQAPVAAAAAVTLAGTAAGQAPVTAAGVLAVSGTADAAVPAPASGMLTVTGAGAGQALAPATGSAVLAGTASASGPGAANAAGALAVTGTGTSAALAGAAGSVTVAGSAGAAAPASTAGTLALTGMAAAAAPAAAAGYMDLSGTAAVSAPAAPAGNAAFNGTAAGAAPVPAGGSVSVSGGAAAAASAGTAGAFAFAGAVTAGEPASAAGGLAVSGAATTIVPSEASGAFALSGTAGAAVPVVAAGSMVLHGTAAAAGPGVTVVVTCLAVDYLAYSVIAAERLAYFTGAVDRGG